MAIELPPRQDAPVPLWTSAVIGDDRVSRESSLLAWPMKADIVSIAALVAAVLVSAPALAVFLLALAPHGAESELAGGLMRDGVIGTLLLMLIGGGGAIACGAAAAWLVTLCRFPGRGVFEWLLVAPLAAPSYVLAYAYSSLTWAGGPIAFPITGFWGAAFVYSLGLYPYVYLAARAAFASQSVCALEAARTLGARPGALIWRVALPLARPGIVAGGALALMEIAADYGAAQHFGVTTMSTAIFRAWYGHGAPHAALQISALLLAAALFFLLIERRARGRRSYAGGSSRWRPLPRYQLRSFPALGAALFCGLLVLLGALLPLAWLARLALLRSADDIASLGQPLLNSLLLAGVGAAVTLVLAALIAVAARRGDRIGRAGVLAAGMGYAAPGAVIALGALSLFALARQAHWIGGFGGAVALATLFWTYAARFSAAGAQSIDAGLSRLATGVDASARTLGAGPLRRLIAIDLPIAAPSAAAAALIVFVEILKELPATLILRPFDFDTLAVKAYAYASDERLIQSAAPALAIFLAGLAPILFLSRRLSRARAGAR
ncbi:MAG TPA: iron ABC transporter permease [Caulobacterales bacterium]|nr:iron ABC transporter permease [Caulobacterales bacterium]